jgi:hypothetical protein
MTITAFPSIFLVREQGIGLLPVPRVKRCPALMMMIQSPSIFTTNGQEMVGLRVAILLNAMHPGDLEIRRLDLQNVAMRDGPIMNSRGD